MLGEDVEYQSDAVHDIAPEGLVKVSLLRWRQLIVEHDDVDVLCVRHCNEFCQFPLADERCRVWPFAAHELCLHGFGPCRVCQQGELDQACFTSRTVVAGANESYQHCPLSRHVEVGDGRGQPFALPVHSSFLVVAHRYNATHHPIGVAG